MANAVVVSNISPQVTEQHLREFFSYCGSIKDFEVQKDSSTNSVTRLKIEFSNAEEVKTALCLNNTALGGSMIRIEPLAMLQPNPQVSSEVSQAQQAELSKQLTYAEQLQAAKNEEIARTVYCGNINSRVSIQQLVDFFSECGPVAFIRMAGNDQQPTRFAFVEFVDISGAQRAMSMSGRNLEDKPIKVNSSNNPILKPPVKLSHEEQRRLQFAISQLSEKIQNPNFQVDYTSLENYHPSSSRTHNSHYYNYDEEQGTDSYSRGRKRGSTPSYDISEERRAHGSHRHRYDERERYSSSRYPKYRSRSRSVERSSRHGGSGRYRRSSRSPEREYKRHKYE